METRSEINMSSVPLSFWPNNLSSVAWLGICVLVLIAWLIGYNNAATGTTICIGLFCLDQLVLGPIWHWKTTRKRQQ